MAVSQVIPVIALLIAGASAQLVSPQPTERPVQDTVRFYYEESLHYLVGAMISNCFLAPLTLHYLVGTMISNCFLAPLTLVEDDHIRIHDGIEDLMLTMMRDWIGVMAETRIYHDDPNLPEDIKHWCQSRDIFLIERNLPAQTTPASPLSG